MIDTLSPRRIAIEQGAETVLRVIQPVGITRVQTTATTVYTAGGTFDFLMRSLWANNVTGSSATLTLHMVPASGSATAANMWINALPIPANGMPVVLAHESYLRPLLQPGMSLVALSNTADAINIGGWGQDVFGAGDL